MYVYPTMSEKMSRRELTKRALAGAAALAVPALGAAQTTEITDAEVALSEKELAKPLSEDTRKILKGAIKNSRDQAKARMATKLPDISEPCFVYHPIPMVKK